VLQRVVDKNMRLPDAAQQVINDRDGTPIAIADFFYQPRIVVFVDGSPHHLDYVQAADDRKRQALRRLGYRVVVVRGSAIDEDIQALNERLD
ncbi:MAG TPA: DUF559 domain-containing protein, partial [Bellilinea sp.]|nr:DUF559 domain-containing protein [Bellilinea sp.]